MSAIEGSLLDAVEVGDLARVEELVREGADINFRGNDPEGESPLMRAIASNQLEMTAFLIALGADVNCVARISGMTPLMLAVGKPLIMAELLAHGADVKARSASRLIEADQTGRKIRRGGETALHLAAAANDVDAIHALIAAGAEVEARDETGQAPLDCALKTGAPTRASIALAEAGAALTPERLEVMHSAALPEEDYSAFRFEAAKANGKTLDTKTLTALAEARVAESFQQRERPWFKLHLITLCLPIVGIFLFWDKIGLSRTGLSFFNIGLFPALFLTGIIFLRLRAAWNESSSNCPRCHRNIRTCSAEYCAECGKKLENGLCRNCKEVRSRTLFGVSWDCDKGLKVRHCPGCGVWLDTHLRRGKWGRRDSF